MKKNVLRLAMGAALVALALPAVAQRGPKGPERESFAPEKGDWSTELQFNPFSNNFETFKLERIQASYMLTDKDAIRFGLGLNVVSNTTTPAEVYDDLKAHNKHGHFAINVGYERHFFNYKRIDLYAGAELNFKSRWASASEDVMDEIKYDSSTGEIISYTVDENKLINYDTEGNRAGFDFGLNLFTGINFYVYKGLYVGAELGLGIASENDKWKKTQLAGEKESKGQDKSSSFNMEFKANPALRLGWTF